MTTRRIPALHPFVGRDAPWLLDAQANIRPESVLLAWEPFDAPAASWTYAQFAAETRRLAGGLAAAGIQAGDFVVLHMDNCPEFLLTWFACGRLGAVVVTTNTRSTGEDLSYFIEHCGAKAAVTQPRYIGLIAGAANGRLAWIASIERDWGLETSTTRPDGIVRFETLLQGDAETPPRTPEPMAPMSVQYTSGTTARPKGVVWTHANVLWGARITVGHLRLKPEDVTPVVLPLFHANGILYSTLPTIWSGGTVVMMPRFSASRFWEIAVRHRCTWASLVGLPVRALLELPPPEGLALKLIGYGAGDIAAVQQRWGARTLGWFGMTETVSQCIMSDIVIPGPPMSMGVPTPEYEVALRLDDGSDAAPGQTGRLLIRGTPGLSLFLEYLNNPEATAAAFDADGWFDTGDLAVADASGEMYFAGREKDMLKVAGENVAAIEIETVIQRVPGVVEVAVVGRPDPMRDEVPVAFVVARAPGADLEAQINAICLTALADFKRPREVIFIDDLPKGTLDKVLKRELRAKLKAAPSATRTAAPT